jgi:hypothetical protein
MFETLQKLEHHVRTVFGESKICYVQRGKVPIQGVGQGNGAGPQIWALVSTPVLNMLREAGLGATFLSALSQISTTLVGFAFVDDTDLITSGPRMPLKEVLSTIQESLNAWKGGIRATGGAIEPTKSHWYLVDFAWKHGNPVYKTVEEIGASLQVRDPYGVVQPVKQLQPWQAERTLGVRLAPDGNMDTQFLWMLDKAKSWADQLRTGYLPRHLTWVAWRTTILKTLQYPLPTTTLSRAQCSKITSTIAKVALPRCGIMRSFPRALLHAPLAAGGLNMPDLYVEQGISHLLRLIRYSQSHKHSTGILLRQSCEALKLELGTNGPLFSNPLSLLAIATDSWVKATWQFAMEYGITVIDELPDLVPSREHDQLLIPTMMNLGFGGSDLQKINQCRKYLQVSWVGDIVTADGEFIERHAVEPPYQLFRRTSHYFPCQANPPPDSWQIWVRAITLLCDKGRRLKIRIGHRLRPQAVMWWNNSSTQRI